MKIFKSLTIIAIALATLSCSKDESKNEDKHDNIAEHKYKVVIELDGRLDIFYPSAILRDIEGGDSNTTVTDEAGKVYPSVLHGDNYKFKKENVFIVTTKNKGLYLQVGATGNEAFTLHINVKVYKGDKQIFSNSGTAGEHTYKLIETIDK